MEAEAPAAGSKPALWRVRLCPLRRCKVARCSGGPASPAEAGAHPHSVQFLDLGVQAVADAQQIENGLGPQTVQQPFGEIADVVLPEVPRGQDPRRDAALCVDVAAVTEVLAQVVAVPEPLHKLCKSPREGEHASPRLANGKPTALCPPPPTPSHSCEVQDPDGGVCIANTVRALRASEKAPAGAGGCVLYGHSGALLSKNRGQKKRKPPQILLNLEDRHCKQQCRQKNTRLRVQKSVGVYPLPPARQEPEGWWNPFRLTILKL